MSLLLLLTAPVKLPPPPSPAPTQTLQTTSVCWYLPTVSNPVFMSPSLPCSSSPSSAFHSVIHSHIRRCKHMEPCAFILGSINKKTDERDSDLKGLPANKDTGTYREKDVLWQRQLWRETGGSSLWGVREVSWEEITTELSPDGWELALQRSWKGRSGMAQWCQEAEPSWKTEVRWRERSGEWRGPRRGEWRGLRGL